MSGSRRRVRQPEIRPDQILDAAQALLLSEGPAAMTMDAVAEAAGIGKGTIYHYYDSKTEVLGALRARHLQRVVAEAQAAAHAEAQAAAHAEAQTEAPAEAQTERQPEAYPEPQAGPPSTLVRLERFVRALIDSIVKNGEFIWILYHQTGVDDEDELAALYEAMLDLVRQGVATGELAVADPEFATEFLVHGLHGVVESSLHRGDVDLGRLNTGMQEAMRALLRPDGVGRGRAPHRRKS